MKRRLVSVAVTWLALPFTASAAPVACPVTISTSDPAIQRTYAEFRRAVEGSPLGLRLGRPVSCTARTEDGAIHLTYESPSGARLEASRDPAIESTEQRFTEGGMSRPTAVSLLQRTERWAFGDKGCGIAWPKEAQHEPGATPGTRELVYRGYACNCQASLVYAGDLLTAVSFRSAC